MAANAPVDGAKLLMKELSGHDDEGGDIDDQSKSIDNFYGKYFQTQKPKKQKVYEQAQKDYGPMAKIRCQMQKRYVVIHKKPMSKESFVARLKNP